MQQNSAEWHQWRGKGLGSSDAPIVMGKSKWATRYELWLQKTGLAIKKEFSNYATSRGHNLEAIARKHWELETGLKAPATNFTHAEYDYLRASLDGYNAQNNLILEIKCPGKADHDTAKQMRVPLHYWSKCSIKC
jgi:putative phage-type endonuclease